MRTYWFYYDGKPIYSIRREAGLSKDDARSQALMALNDNPTLYADHPDVNPDEQRRRLVGALVCYYPQEDS